MCFSFGANKKHEPRRANQPLIFILCSGVGDVKFTELDFHTYLRRDPSISYFSKRCFQYLIKKHEPRRVNQPLILILSFISRFYIPNFHNNIWRLLYDIIRFFPCLFYDMRSWLLNGKMQSETVQEASRLYTGIVWRNEPSFLDEWTVKILFIHA